MNFLFLFCLARSTVLKNTFWVSLHNVCRHSRRTRLSNLENRMPFFTWKILRGNYKITYNGCMTTNEFFRKSYTPRRACTFGCVPSDFWDRKNSGLYFFFSYQKVERAVAQFVNVLMAYVQAGQTTANTPVQARPAEIFHVAVRAKHAVLLCRPSLKSTLRESNYGYPLWPR